MAETPEPVRCEVDISDLTESFGDDLLQRLARIPFQVLRKEGASGSWSVSLAFTTDQHLSQMHGEYLGDDSLTDIITFSYDDDVHGDGHSGEMVISVDRAAEQANDAGWGLDEELAFLVIHGMLHLCGWDDLDEFSRTRMLARQRELLNNFGR